jgi:hypothetical protein
VNSDTCSCCNVACKSSIGSGILASRAARAPTRLGGAKALHRNKTSSRRGVRIANARMFTRGHSRIHVDAPVWDSSSDGTQVLASLVVRPARQAKASSKRGTAGSLLKLADEHNAIRFCGVQDCGMIRLTRPPWQQQQAMMTAQYSRPAARAPGTGLARSASKSGAPSPSWARPWSADIGTHALTSNARVNGS